MCIFNHSLINCVIIARTVVLATISVWLPYTAWREALALLKFVEIDDWPKICQIFTIQIFMHLQSLTWISNKLIERYFLGMCPTICSWGTIDHFLIAMTCGWCEIPVSCSQSKSPSAERLSCIEWYLCRIIESIQNM